MPENGDQVRKKLEQLQEELTRERESLREISDRLAPQEPVAAGKESAPERSGPGIGAIIVMGIAALIGLGLLLKLLRLFLGIAMLVVLGSGAYYLYRKLTGGDSGEEA
jgi:hypothetical protein